MARKVPLDDPRWLPWMEARRLLLPQSGLFATFDLVQMLRSDKLGCMRRSMTNPNECERVRASFWHDVEIDESLIDHGIIRFNRGPDRLDARSFYVWKPHFTKALPALAPQQPINESEANESEASEPLRRKPGRKPKQDWKLFVAAKLWELRKAGRPIPTAADFAQLCEDELRYQPDISEIQKWLRQLLG